MDTLSFAKILIAGFAAFVLGGLWYSPKVFGRFWGHEAHMKANKKGHPLHIYIVTFVFYVLTAWAFSYGLGMDSNFERSMEFALIVGLCFVSASFAINYMFAGRSSKMLLIDAGYHTMQFLIYGLLFGLWH